MFKRLKSMLTSESAPAAAPRIETVIAPQAPFCAVGDIHGCLDLLTALLQKIGAEIPAAPHIVFLGDYIDRGPRSAQVLAHLFELQQAEPERITCLMGNHEKMMLEFIDDPLGKGARWLVNGGLDTLKSYGIETGKTRPDAEDAMAAADALEAALPGGLQDWLRGLPMQWSSGNMHCVHAAMDPARPPEQQSERVLLWGSRGFMSQPREDGQTVVFGHVITSRPEIRDGRVSVDTGAYKTGRLTAACIEAGACRFLST